MKLSLVSSPLNSNLVDLNMAMNVRTGYAECILCVHFCFIIGSAVFGPVQKKCGLEKTLFGLAKENIVGWA